MVNNLVKLYNTLLLIETKGENTKIMSNCLQFLENLVAEERNKEIEATNKVEPTSEE